MTPLILWPRGGRVVRNKNIGRRTIHYITSRLSPSDILPHLPHLHTHAHARNPHWREAEPSVSLKLLHSTMFIYICFNYCIWPLWNFCNKLWLHMHLFHLRGTWDFEVFSFTTALFTHGAWSIRRVYVSGGEPGCDSVEALSRYDRSAPQTTCVWSNTSQWKEVAESTGALKGSLVSASGAFSALWCDLLCSIRDGHSKTFA